MAIDLKEIVKGSEGLNKAVDKVKILRAELTKTYNALEQLDLGLANTSKKITSDIDIAVEEFNKAKDSLNTINSKTTETIKNTLDTAKNNTEVKKGLAVAQKIEDIKSQLLSANNVDGLQLANELSDVNQLRTIQAKIEEIKSNLSKQSGLLDQEKQANLLSELAYQKKLAELQQNTAVQLKKQVAELEAFKLSDRSGSEKEIQGTIDSTERQSEVHEQLSEGPVNKITRNSINTGLNENLGKVFSGDMTFAEMGKGIFSNIQQQLTQQMMQNISQIMTQMSMNLIKMISEPLKEGIGGALNSLFGDSDSMLGGLGEQMKGLFSGMDEMFGGFFSKLFQGTGSNFSSMFSSDGLSGLFSLVTTFFLADGGMVRGPGTETSDSIPAWLSNGEFVTRASVVKQPGMLPLLHNLNRNGISALADYSLRIKHATGGLAGIPAPSAPSLGLSSIQPSATNVATTVENAVNLHVYDDPQRIINSSFSDNGMESYYLKIERNPQRLKSILGV